MNATDQSIPDKLLRQMSLVVRNQPRLQTRRQLSRAELNILYTRQEIPLPRLSNPHDHRPVVTISVSQSSTKGQEPLSDDPVILLHKPVDDKGQRPPDYETQQGFSKIYVTLDETTAAAEAGNSMVDQDKTQNELPYTSDGKPEARVLRPQSK